MLSTPANPEQQRIGDRLFSVCRAAALAGLATMFVFVLGFLDDVFKVISLPRNPAMRTVVNGASLLLFAAELLLWFSGVALARKVAAEYAEKLERPAALLLWYSVALGAVACVYFFLDRVARAGAIDPYIWSGISSVLALGLVLGLLFVVVMYFSFFLRLFSRIGRADAGG